MIQSPSSTALRGIVVQRKNLLRELGLPRVPLPAGIINVNFCKNPVCPNFGIPAQVENVKRGRGNTSPDDYVVMGKNKPGVGTRIPMLHCKKCGEKPTLKSNLGILQEYERAASSLLYRGVGFSCPDTACPNNNNPAEITAKKDNPKKFTLSRPESYRLYGKTPQGTRRIQCKECGRIFSPVPSTPIARQRKSHVNKSLFALLMNKSPLRRICEILSLSPLTIYRKIDFIHRQCLSFAAERETEWAEKGCRRLYVAVDRQDYVVNWKRRQDKRNIVLSAVGSADNATGYVFGMHLNYDPSLDSAVINADAAIARDPSLPFPFRKYARLWLDCDYEESVQRSANKRTTLNNDSGDLLEMVKNKYTEAIQRDDVEVSERLDSTKSLPWSGMQVHSEYTLYAHFFFLRHFFRNAGKVRFFLDQDSGMRAGALGAFCDRVKDRTCDAFYVRINKEMTVDERKRWLSAARNTLRRKKAQHSEWNELTAAKELMKEALRESVPVGKWKDKWVLSPLPGMDEPEKAICYLTDYGDYDEDHLANLFCKASLRGIDRFFMQVQRRISLLERPIGTSSNAGRMWYGYSAYNPAVIVKLLDIFRVFYNYTRPGNDKMTPAMRIGMAKSAIGLDEILYFL